MDNGNNQLKKETRNRSHNIDNLSRKQAYTEIPSEGYSARTAAEDLNYGKRLQNENSKNIDQYKPMDNLSESIQRFDIY